MRVHSGIRSHEVKLLHVNAVQSACKKFLDANVSQGQISGLGRVRRGRFDQSCGSARYSGMRP